MEIWRLIDSGAGSASENMAVAEAILHGCQCGHSPPTLHWYTWKAVSITLGFLQDYELAIQKAECVLEKVPVVRRITGGRGVVHHQDLGFSLIFPIGGCVIPPGISSSYRKVALGFVEGLKELGIGACLADGRSMKNCSRRESKGMPACFLTRVNSEIIVAGQKIMGFAQRRMEGWVLQQGTIMIDLERSLWARLLRYPESVEPWKLATRLESEVTSIREAAGRDVAISAVKKALTNGLSKVLGIEFTAGGLSAGEREEAEILAGEKYQDLLHGGHPQSPAASLTAAYGCAKGYLH